MPKEKEIGTEVAVALRSNVQLAEVAPLEQFAKLKEAGAMIAQSGMFGSNISASGGALIAMTMYKENLSPVEFKRRYHMVNNQPSRTVNSLLGDFKLTGGKYKIHVADAKSCKITFTTKDGDEYTCEVVMDEMLKTSIPFGKDGRTLKDNWRNCPDDMLFARCCGKGLRRIAPELMGGVYTKEEQEDIQPVEVAGTVSPSPIAGTEAKSRLKKLQSDKPNAAPKKDKPETEVVEPEVVQPEKKKPVVAGVTVRTTWTFSVDDPDAVPREFCKPDEVLIRQYMQNAKANGAKLETLRIPGITFMEKVSV